MGTLIVVLVPWRGGERLRERNWKLTRPHLEALGYPLFLGDRVGPWSRAAACNAAAAAAGDWDVAVIADADTIPEPEPVRRAVGIAAETGGAVRPHDKLWRLRHSTTPIIARRGPSAIGPQHTTGTHLGGGLLVVARSGWDRVGGFDERFVGWGHEDSAFNHRVLAAASWRQIEGNAWHLWHPSPKPASPEYRRNRALLAELERSNVLKVRRASRKAGYDVGAVL